MANTERGDLEMVHQVERAERAEAALAESRKQIEVLEIMDMTATAKQWEGAYLSERAKLADAREAAQEIVSVLQDLIDRHERPLCPHEAPLPPDVAIAEKHESRRHQLTYEWPPSQDGFEEQESGTEGC